MARTLEALVIAELGQLRYMMLVQQSQLEDYREKLAKAEGQRVKLAESQAKVQEVSAQLAKQMTSKLTKPARTT